MCRRSYDIRFTETTYNFGTVVAGEDVNHIYTFKNTGAETLVIKHVQPACVCTVASDWDRTVAPGKWGRIPVSFKAPDLNGEVIKIIFVKTNIPEQPSIQLTLKGRVLIPVEIVPQNTWLGNVTAQTKSLSGSFDIKNNLETPLEIYEIIPPDPAAEYTLIIIEEKRKYRLDYTIYPPFEGKGTTGGKFTLKTNREPEEFLYLNFYYFVE